MLQGDFVGATKSLWGSKDVALLIDEIDLMANENRITDKKSARMLSNYCDVATECALEMGDFVLARASAVMMLRLHPNGHRVSKPTLTNISREKRIKLVVFYKY